MPKLPPPAVVSVAEAARAGLDVVKRSLVPPPIAALDHVQNFWAFHVVFAFAELRVADALFDGPRPVAALAPELGADAESLYRLLRAASMIGLCEEHPERVFALRAIGRALSERAEGSFRDFIIFTGKVSSRMWRRLPDGVRTGKTGIELEVGKQPWEYVSGDPEIAEILNRGMTAASNASGDALVAAYDFSFASTIADIGGGHGRLLALILHDAKNARGVLFDRPSVVAGAAALLEAHGMTARVQVSGGDFFESVPSGCDCYVMKSVIHDWNDDDACKILASIRKAMPPHARVLLCEAIVGPRNANSFAKLLDLEMLIMSGGRERTVDEYRALFASAGLKLERTLSTASPLSIIEARAA